MSMISIDSLSYTYPGSSSPTLKNINFTIRRGEIFGLLGPSGAGKSTTQKILTNQLTGFAGNVVVMHTPIQQWGSDLYNHIGVGFELPNHYLKLTALENLQFFSAFYDVPVRDLLELLKMVGLEGDADRRVESYSKGMKMRLNFIRAIMHDPQILFLDEPTAGLDPANARLIKDIILQKKLEGKTILFTTHNMHDADELCDRVAFLFQGEIPSLDTPARLKQKAGKRAVVVQYTQDGELQVERFPLEDIGRNPAFLQTIRERTIERISTEEPSLEQIFIQLTGKTLS